MVKVTKFYILVALLLVSLTLVSSAPPTQSTTIIEKGIQIEVPVIEFIEVNQTFKFHLHAHNATAGKLLDNTTTWCILHIYRPSNGGHLFEGNMSFDSNLVDFEKEILGGNFSESGQYAALMYCEADGEIGGFIEYSFMVTKTGTDLTEGESTIYLIMTLSMLFFFLLIFFLMLIVPYKNEVNEKGMVIKVCRAKYVKILLIGLSFLFFIWFLNILIAVSDNYSVLPQYFGHISFLFLVLNTLSLPFGIFLIVLSFFELIRDANFNKRIEELGESLHGKQ